MAKYNYRNIPCAHCGDLIAQAIKPPGQALHKRCKLAARNPVRIVPQKGGHRKITVAEECAWCMGPTDRRPGQPGRAICGYTCRTHWTNFLAGRTSSAWPKPPKPYVVRFSRVYFIQCPQCNRWKCKRHNGNKPTVYCSSACAHRHLHANGKTSNYVRRLVWFLNCDDCTSLHCSRSPLKKRCDSCYALNRYRENRDTDKVSLLLPYIGQRDRWKCQICGTKVPRRSYSSRDRMSPTVDHVVTKSEARAMGWSDEQVHDLANLRLAHMICNSRRGARGGNEQLALVG